MPAAIITHEYPDIVLLQEAYNCGRSLKLARETGYRLLRYPGDENSHVRIMSRLPMHLVGAITLPEHGNAGKHAVCAEVETKQGPLTVCSVHLISLPYKYRELKDAKVTDHRACNHLEYHQTCKRSQGGSDVRDRNPQL